MKVDLEDSAAAGHFVADICIVGGGIAGLTLANALQKSGMNIAVLEGGGLTPEKRSQDLYAVEMAGHHHTGATQGRFRIFGGSSTQWGGQLLPYSEDVFKPPQSANTHSWPVQNAELEPFYPAVLQNFGVPDEPFVTGSLSSGGIEPVSPDADVNVRFSRWASFNRRNLAATLGKQCLESQAISVYLHANVTRLERGGPASDLVTQISVSNFSNRTFTFAARHVVVCLGVIETVRLLLASGIDGDQVGRYFHDHIGVHAATLTPPARETAIRLFAPRVKGTVLYTPKLEATLKWRERHGTPAVMAHFPIIEPDDSATATVRLLLQSLQSRQLPPGILRRLAALPAGSAELLRMAYSTKILGRRALSKRAEYRLNIDVEQQPSPDSRITLGSENDRFGTPRARLDWRISSAEGEAVRLFAQTIHSELRAIGIDPINIHPELLKTGGNWLSIASDTYHMMGGTRMGTNPTNSVVDNTLKVHVIKNLYIASCSVFPTGGSSNPTFTMMALTLRLANLLGNYKIPPR